VTVSESGAGTSTPPTREPPESGSWVNRGVLGVGTASLFSDASHEMVTSLLPTFVTVSLHAGPGSLGLIEGTSDALTGFAKLLGGPLANDPRRRGRLASGGYLGTALATAGIGLTTAVWQVAALRAFAWISRGIRSPSRDMLLTSLVAKKQFGRAFGVERAGDNTGAIVGPLLASLLVGVIGLRHTILLSIVPGVLAAVSITVAARQARRTIGETPVRRTLKLQLGKLRSAGLGRVLVPIACFELGNVATTLLILRATGLLDRGGPAGLTAATSAAILLYAAHNAVAAGTSLLAGRWCDTRSPRFVFFLGAVAYAVGYAILAVGSRGWPLLLVAFALAGVGIGFAETAESTAVAQALPEALRGNGFGALGLTQALGDLGSTAVAGIIWSLISPTAAFGYAAIWMVAAMVTGALLSGTGSGAADPEQGDVAAGELDADRHGHATDPEEVEHER
jgi:MFS family permease